MEAVAQLMFQTGIGAPWESSGRTVVNYQNKVYVFGINSNDDIFYWSSSNYGANWQFTALEATRAWALITVWFDRWTPGDSGTIIHIWAYDTTNDDLEYYSLDVSTDTLGNGGTGIVVFNGATFLSSASAYLSGAKAKGGNLYVAFDADGGTETGFYRSTDSGSAWTSRSNPAEASSQDYVFLFPGNESDNQDMWLIFWDRSANEISLKTYDDSADSWSEQSISTGMTDIATTSAVPQFYGAMNLSNSHLYLACWNNRATATADLNTWDINGAGSITATSDVVTDSDGSHTVILTIDPNGYVHVTYLGKADGSETLGSVGCYRKTSLDGMSTWSSEQTIYSLADDYRALSGVCNSSNNKSPIVVSTYGSGVYQNIYAAFFLNEYHRMGISSGIGI